MPGGARVLYWRFTQGELKPRPPPQRIIELEMDSFPVQEPLQGPLREGEPAPPDSGPPDSPTIHPWDNVHLYAEALAGHFSIGVGIDLRMLSASVTTVEYNPSTSCARLRLVDPGCTANVYASGVCFLMGLSSVRDALKASGMVVAIFKALGYPVDKVSPLRVMCSVFSGVLPFGVKLDSLAAENQCCLYDPEIYSMLMYRPALSSKLEVCMTIAANGSFIIAGARTVKVARSVLKEIYPAMERNSISLNGAPQSAGDGNEGDDIDLLQSGPRRASDMRLLDPKAIISASDLADLSDTDDSTDASGTASNSGGGSDKSDSGESEEGLTQSDDSYAPRKPSKTASAGGRSLQSQARRKGQRRANPRK